MEGLTWQQPRDTDVQGCSSSRPVCCMPVPVCIHFPERVNAHLKRNSRGQLCTDLEVSVAATHPPIGRLIDCRGWYQEVIQDRYHQQLFAALIPTLEVPESR